MNKIENQQESLEKTKPLSIDGNDELDVFAPPMTQESVVPAPKALKPLKRFWILIGFMLVLIGGGLGYFFGADAAMTVRAQQMDKEVVNVATTQFQLGVRELEEGRLENARKRFEYVIQLIPNFPGAQEKLTEVMFAQANVTTVTPLPSPTITPTPDMRGEEELFSQLQVHLQNQDWDQMIATLDALRKLDVQYRPVDVDGYYYIALRNRGVRRILQQGFLEPGIYDLTLAERFGPLDDDASNYRLWARNYLSGASFWGVDWARVVDIFSQIYPALPNMVDSSGMTAQERYRVALIRWGDQLALAEEWCAAYEKYEMAFAFVVDERVAPTATAVYNECHNPSEPERPSEQPTATPTPPGVTETPPTDVTPTGATPDPTEGG